MCYVTITFTQLFVCVEAETVSNDIQRDVLYSIIIVMLLRCHDT